MEQINFAWYDKFISYATLIPDTIFHTPIPMGSAPGRVAITAWTLPEIIEIKAGWALFDLEKYSLAANIFLYYES